jgi:hypothetical protein
VNEEEVEKFMAKPLRLLNPDDMYNKKLKTVAQMEKLLGQEDKGIIEGFWEKPKGVNELAKLTDKRPAVIPSAESDFIESTEEYKDFFGKE